MARVLVPLWCQFYLPSWNNNPVKNVCIFESLQLAGSYLGTYCTLVSLPLRWYFLREALHHLPEFPSRIQPQFFRRLYPNFSSAFSLFLSPFSSLLPVPLGMTSQINSLHSKSWLTSTWREPCCLSQFSLLKLITIAGVAYILGTYFSWSGGWKSKIRVPVDLVLKEVYLPGLQMAIFLLCPH